MNRPSRRTTSPTSPHIIPFTNSINSISNRWFITSSTSSTQLFTNKIRQQIFSTTIQTRRKTISISNSRRTNITYFFTILIQIIIRKKKILLQTLIQNTFSILISIKIIFSIFYFFYRRYSRKLKKSFSSYPITSIFINFPTHCKSWQRKHYNQQKSTHHKKR